jgi:HAE1 family hydrophobic/amphiphilic exporter-1
MKKLAELAVKYFITFVMLYLGAVGWGLFSLSRLPIDMYPDITFPLIGVITQYEGASPEDIENLITRPVEEAVSAVEGVEEVTSTSRHGVSQVFVEFDWGTDIDQAEIDVRRNLDFLDDVLPDDARDPLAFAFDPSMQPIYFIAVYGPFDQAELRRISRRYIEPQMERLPGVAAADTIGGLVREIQVRFDPDQLLARGIALQQVVAALRAENLQLPGGTIREAGREIPIVTQGQFESVEEIRNVVVGVANGVPIRLRDVAAVEDTFQEENHLIRNNGRSSVMLIVRKQSDANTVATAGAVRDALPGILAEMPEGIQFGVIFDQSQFINESISNLGSTGILAILLTFLVLIFYLYNLRASMVVAVSIPVSVIVTFIVMYAAGVTLNVISMAGLALAIGMLVDNSIVVLENIYRHHELGADPRTAAIEGTGEVAMAITASTLTTIAVFAPVLFVEGIAGVMFKDMALTICVSLTASLLVAITLVPMLASRLLRSRVSEAVIRVPTVRRRIVYEGLTLAVLMLLTGLAIWKEVPQPLATGLPAWAEWAAIGVVTWGLMVLAKSGVAERANNAMARGYARALDWVLVHPWTTVSAFVVSLALSSGLLYITGADFFPNDDNGMVFLRMDAAVGSSAQQTDTYFRRAEKAIARAVPEAVYTAVEVGQAEGFGSLFSEGSHAGILRIKLRPLMERSRSAEQIEEVIRREVNKIPGVTATVFQPFGFGGDSDISIEIIGHDLDVARRVGLEIKEIVSADRGARDVEFSMDQGRPQLEVHLNRDRMAALGINSLAVNQTVSTFFQGTTASIFREGGDEFEIRVRAASDLRHNRRYLEELRLLSPLGKQVPLGTIARIEERLGPVEITRQDQERVVTVKATSVVKGDLAGLTTRLQKRLDAYPWPDDFTYRISGTAEDLQDSFIQLAWAMVAAVLLVYMVMASQFESLLSPFIIFLTIPLTPIGIGIALFLTSTPISVVGLIGVIMLAGVVVNNSIVLVDYANQRREAGLGIREAIYDAGKTRLRPILMTALTTVLGMVPLALELGAGAASWSPLARVVIGGLTGSTFITLLFVPVAYIGMIRSRKVAPVESIDPGQ